MRGLHLLLTLLVCLASTARADEPVKNRGPAQQQLARECDDLLAKAVRRPYGWAWAQEDPDSKTKALGQPVETGPAASAAAGFVLYWAGEFLDEPKYKEAAYQAARGVAASQRPTGAFPRRPTFLPNVAGGRDDVALVADRAPTCAAEALILTICEESGNKDELLRSSATRGLTWMMRQQSTNGAWPQADPPATQPKDAVRIVRLDNPDWRDCTYAMLLAGDVLADAPARRSAARANDALVGRMRLGGSSRVGGPLWATAYTLAGAPTDRLADFPPAVDVLASRRAMQSVLGTLLVAGDPPPPKVVDPDAEPQPTPSRALAEAATAIGHLPKFDGLWVRLYDFDVSHTPPPLLSKAVGFEKEPPPSPPRQQVGTWGLDSVLRTIATIQDAGRDGAIAKLSADVTIHQRLAAAMCGLEEDPFAMELVSRKAEEDAPPTEKLEDRTRRLWRLYLSAKAEAHH